MVLLRQAAPDAQKVVDNATIEANEIPIWCDPVIQMTFFANAESHHRCHDTVQLYTTNSGRADHFPAGVLYDQFRSKSVHELDVS